MAGYPSYDGHMAAAAAAAADDDDDNNNNNNNSYSVNNYTVTDMYSYLFRLCIIYVDLF